MRRKKGRPVPEGGVRDQYIMIRVNGQEARKWTIIAEKLATSRAEVGRKLVEKAYLELNCEQNVNKI